MRVFILTVLALALVHCQDYSCPKGKSKTKKIVLSPGDSFTYNTNFDDKYYPKTKCPVAYKASKKCKKGIRFSCDAFDLPNRDAARCRKGDKLILGKKAYCGSKVPAPITLKGKAAKKGLRVLFASDKKNVGAGAQCTAMCLDGATTTTTAAPTTTSEPEPSCDCGLANQPSKIFGGEEAQPHEYPWNVYVSMKKGTSWYMCGGAIISNQHILTAAHCVDEGQKAKNLFIRIGAHNKNDPEIEARVSKIDVPSTWNMDEDFGWNVSDGPDAAILTLKEPIEFNWKMRPICLPSDPSVTYDGEVAQATGWGRIENNGSPTNLMKVDVKVIDIQTCMNSFGSVVDSIHICATGVDASDFGTRGGDSGSPLNYPEVGGRYSIIGINSFNSDPDVFTKVTPELKNWILSLVPGAQIADPTSTTGCSKA